MRPESKKLLIDARDAASAVTEFSAGKSFADFTTDKLLRAGVHHQFVIIGEVLAQLRASDTETVERISEFQRIIGFRNQLIHGYARIDDEITWQIIQTKLPILQRELDALIVE